jgi:tRNA dimethylallyltransferase
MTQKIICLMGPTASGKSNVALSLAQKLPVEIISVDSAQVYRDMNIGTAKPTTDEQDLVPHHLINVLDPDESYSTAQFIKDAQKLIKEIVARNKIPLLVGGTMLYFKSLLFGLNELPSANYKIRAELDSEATLIGWHKMHERLQSIDPDAANKIHKNDTQRIQRALEVFKITGKTITELCAEKKNSNDLQAICIALRCSNRKKLHQKIAARFNDMLQRGFVDEVKNLRAKWNLNLSMPSMRSVGYRQVWDYLEQDTTYDEMQDKAIIATRQLAKRQITWLNAWDNLHWFDCDDPNLATNIFSYIKKNIDLPVQLNVRQDRRFNTLPSISAKILIVAPSWVGDVMMSQGLLQVLKQRYQDCTIDVLAQPYLKPLLKHMSEINQVIDSPFVAGKLSLWCRIKFGLMLRKYNYSHTIVLPNSFKSAIAPFFARIPIRVGWLGECRYFLLNKMLKLDKKKYPLMLQRYLSLSDLMPHCDNCAPKIIKHQFGDSQPNIQDFQHFFPVLNTVEIEVNKAKQKFGISDAGNKNILAICPGAQYGKTKQWPAEYFAKIVNVMRDRGWSIWLFGSHKDCEIANTINALCANVCLDLTGKTSLGEVVDLMSCAKLVVSNDSGLMHIAAALDLDLIAIFGSTSPQFTPPLSNKAVVIQSNMECSPCFAKQCKLGNYKCLQELKPELVLQALDGLVKK